MVSIIGSGPAGITCAYLLAVRVYDITIFESEDKIGGVLRYGIPDYRLPKDIIDKLKIMLCGMGMKTRKVTKDTGEIIVETIDGSRVFLSADSVIIAASQSPRANIIFSTKGVLTNKFRLVVTGAKTVVEAVHYSKKSASTIEEYINSLQ